MIDWEASSGEDTAAFWPNHRHRERAGGRPVQLCANCGERFPCPPKGRLAPFCSLRCKGAAEAIRYGRARLAEYDLHHITDLPGDFRDALSMKVAHSPGGGYDDSVRRLTPQMRRAVSERD